MSDYDYFSYLDIEVSNKQQRRLFDIEDRQNLSLKSKERVRDHGEIFTPQWMVELMLNQPEVQEDISSLHTTVLEPAAGEGVFLVEALKRKLSQVNDMADGKYLTSWRRNMLWALMSIYGIEFLDDNLVIARDRILEAFLIHYEETSGQQLGIKTKLYKTAKYIVTTNVIQGDALSRTNKFGLPLVFSEWQNSTESVASVKRTLFTLDDRQYDVLEYLKNFGGGNVNLQNQKSEHNQRLEFKEVSLEDVYKELVLWN